MKRRLRLACTRLGDRIYHLRWLLLAAILGRFATVEMRHAALLLGYSLAHGYGTEGVLGALPEFMVGNELGVAVRGRDPVAAFGAAEAYELEHLRFARADVPVGGAS